MLIFLQTVAVGGLGALIATYLGVPAPFLTGPASFVSVAGLMGLKTRIPDNIRDIVFLTIGLTLGASVTPATLAAAGTWPISLIAMCISVGLTMVLGGLIIRQCFGMDRRSALLASSPGHLSFVLSFSSDIGADTALISVIQSMRILILTLLVPVAITVLTDANMAVTNSTGPIISVVNIAILAVFAALLGFGMLKIRVPAAYLLGGMIISSIGHGVGLTPGNLPEWLSNGAFAMMGAFIGTRFSGVTLGMLKKAAIAGTAVTVLGLVLAIITSFLVAKITGLPALNLIIALAPGGFETMAAMSAVVGADPAFVTFHHVARLFFLSLFVPIVLAWKSAQP